jgi:hypothetical protein
MCMTSRRGQEGQVMKAFLLGAAVGYVLGTRAGRDRYEQLARTYRQVIDHPAVQGAAGVARAKIGEKTGIGQRTSKPQTPADTDGHRHGAATPGR